MAIKRIFYENVEYICYWNLFIRVIKLVELFSRSNVSMQIQVKHVILEPSQVSVSEPISQAQLWPAPNVIELWPRPALTFKPLLPASTIGSHRKWELAIGMTLWLLQWDCLWLAAMYYDCLWLAALTTWQILELHALSIASMSFPWVV